MNNPAPQSTLREWLDQMSNPVTLAALAGVGLVAGVAGPFGTAELMRLVPRLAYWVVLTALCYGAGVLVNTWTGKLLGWVPPWRHVLLSGLGTGCAVTALVCLMNLLALNFVPPLSALPELIGSVMVVCITVNALLYLLHRDEYAERVPKAPPLLARLPVDLRGDLVALSGEDHYTRVRTARGEDLILLRLGDAMGEVGGTAGARVHRSHWVALDQVQSVRREGDRAILTMTSGPEIPCSRANLPKLREAGLLPR